MIENALLLCRPRSGGEHSGTRTNKKCHLLRGALAHTGGMSASVCAHAFVCVLAPFFMPTGGRHLISAAAGEKQANMSAQICAEGTRPS